MIDLSGRVVLVTGGNSGIARGVPPGRRVRRDLVASRGAQRRGGRRAGGLGATAIGLQCDVTGEDNAAGAMRATLDPFGRLDCLVANAGTVGKQSFADMSLAEWHRVLQVNLDGAFLCLREAARVLVGQGQGGSLVGVSSTSAIDGAPGQEHYAASKTALLAVMRALAVELARHQVRCNSLLPGWTDTELLAGAKTHEKFVNATIQGTPVRRCFVYLRGRGCAPRGNAGGAAAAFRELLHDQLRVFGAHHPDTLETRLELAERRGQSGDITGAITELRQLLTDQQRVLGSGHPLTLTILAHLTRWEELPAPQDRR